MLLMGYSIGDQLVVANSFGISKAIRVARDWMSSESRHDEGIEKAPNVDTATQKRAYQHIYKNKDLLSLTYKRGHGTGEYIMPSSRMLGSTTFENMRYAEKRATLHGPCKDKGDVPWKAQYDRSTQHVIAHSSCKNSIIGSIVRFD